MKTNIIKSVAQNCSDFIKTGNKSGSIIPNSKTTSQTNERVATKLDQTAAKVYFEIMTYRTGITPQEVAKLFKKEGTEFFDGIYDFLIKSAKIPPEFKPQIRYFESNPNTIMAYDFVQNLIYVYLNQTSNLSKAQIFGCLRHEIQHLKQNLDIYRHETLGEEAVEFNTKKMVGILKEFVLSMIKKSDKELADMGHKESFINDINLYKLLYKQSEQLLDAHIKKTFYSIYKNEFLQLRQKIIDKMGIIKDGTNEAKQAKYYFDDHKNRNNSSLGKYIANKTEMDAFFVGEYAKAEALGECPFKAIKNAFKTLFSNKKTAEDIIQHTKERKAIYDNS